MFIKKINDNNRYCIYCNENIGYKLLSAKICGSVECTKKLGDDIKRNPVKNKVRYCLICGDDISNLASQSKICKKEECKKEQIRRNYAKHKYNKICNICGTEFIGTQKQTVCSNCKQTSYKRKLENIEKIELQTICSSCGKIINTTLKYNTNNINSIIYKLCDECNNKHKEEIYKQFSERMKTNNPMFNKDISLKVGHTLRNNYLIKCAKNNIIPHKQYIKPDIPETIEQLSERMKTNNPMFNKDSVNKMKETLQKHITDGTVVYKKGKDSPLWKGNRLLNKAVRISLRKWVKYMFEKYDYICQNCGKTHTELHVHHKEPLRDIINNFLIKYNYTTDYLYSIEGTDEYNKFIDDIVLYHYDNEYIGIVVCPECHNKLDKYYNKNNKNDKTNSES